MREDEVAPEGGHTRALEVAGDAAHQLADNGAQRGGQVHPGGAGPAHGTAQPTTVL
jgi:hypothetical protein